MKAVIFDMDGVIVDSNPIHLEAENMVLKKYGISLSYSEMLKKYNGTTTKFMFEDLIKTYNLNANAEEMCREKTKLIFELCSKYVPATKGIINLIKNLKEHKFKIALASSSDKEIISLILAKLEIKPFFDSIVSAQDITHSKPHPEIFLKAASNLEVPPECCVVVEDATFGVEAAKNAGMKCIGYKNQATEKIISIDLSKADLITDNFNSLNIQMINSLLKK